MWPWTQVIGFKATYMLLPITVLLLSRVRVWVGGRISQVKGG